MTKSKKKKKKQIVKQSNYMIYHLGQRKIPFLSKSMCVYTPTHTYSNI